MNRRSFFTKLAGVLAALLFVPKVLEGEDGRLSGTLTAAPGTFTGEISPLAPSDVQNLYRDDVGRVCFVHQYQDYYGHLRAVKMYQQPDGTWSNLRP